MSTSDAFGKPTSLSYQLPVPNGNEYRLKTVTEPFWPELASILQAASASRIVTFLPPELHLDTLVLLTARHCKLPVTTGSVFDLPWTVAATKIQQADCLISTASVLPFLATALEKTDSVSSISTVITVGEKSPSLALDQAKHHTLALPF